MRITSSAFTDGSPIPVRYAYHGVAGGNNISLPFQWSDVPPNTRSFALSIVDPHPVAKDWVHWLVTDIPAEINELSAAASPRGMPHGCRELLNSYGSLGYGGPEPPPGSGVHPYVATVYALDVPFLRLSEMTTLADFNRAVQKVMIGSASVTGTFER